MKKLCALCCLLLSAGAILAADASPYQVVWTAPSKDVNGTMPLGNGEVGLNAWIDEQGDLRFYISRIDSVDENGQLFKIGAARVSFNGREPVVNNREPAAVQPVSHFKQTLDTKRGVLEAQYQNRSGNDIALRLWVDAHRPVIVIEAAAAKPAAATAFAEIWRTKRETIPEQGTSDSYKVSSYESPNFRNAFKTPEYDNLETIIEPDTILNLPNALGWYHRNVHSKPYQLTAKIQGLDDFERQDPILHRTFGAIIRSGHAKKIDNQTLQSAEGTTHRFEIAVTMKHPAAAEDWLNETQNILDAAQKIPFDERKAQHEQWWNEFWNRSWIHITSTENAGDSAAADDPIPPNRHTVLIGKDQHGGSVFQGELSVAIERGKVFSIAEMKARNACSEVPLRYSGSISDSADWKFSGGMTIEARIKPSKLSGYYRRIADKITPGGSNGFLFDITPQNGLRLVVGPDTHLSKPNIVTKDQWQYVAVTVTPAGTVQFFAGGQPLESNTVKTAYNDAPPNLSDAFALSRAYALQRYVSACAGRGTLPIKFNGSIFTVPEKGRADYRQWGPGYWWQNTRLPYVSMPAAGDFEMLQPLFRTYLDMLPLCKYRTEKYLGHGGAYYPECIFFWGDVFLDTYGWQPWDQRKDKLQKSGYHKYEWVGGLELALMMLEYYEYTGDENFLKEKAIPFAAEILTFFDKHYSVNENGKLVMYPSQAVETWWDCTNPMPEIAGLYAVIEKMEQLPAELLTAETKSFTAKLKQKLPPIPTTPSPEGKPMLAPAERFAQRRNSETPELYAVFPFRQFTYNRPNVEWGIEALKHRRDRGAFGWRQDDTVMAYLGLGDEAAAYLVKRAKTKDAAGQNKSRFPVFWGPNYDWVPDQDHGGILTRGVQSLVMQCDGKQIDLFPAFPKGWNCDFKLHAPYQTVVEGRLEDGKVTNLKVTPKEREKDVRIMNSPNVK